MLEFNKEKMKNLLMYLVLAGIVGVSVGAIDALFGKVLIAIGDFRTLYYQFLIPFLPLAGLLIIGMYYKFSKESLGGMGLVFDTALNKREHIPVLLIPLVMVGTWITHLFGGSAGREGVAVQIGATFSHELGKKFKLPDSRTLLVIGMAAGFSGLFQTPLAAIFFALEVIISGALVYEALLSAVVASYLACFISNSLGLEKFYVPITSSVELSFNTVIPLVLIGIAFGLTGLLFSKGLAFGKKKAKSLIESPYKRIFFMAIPLAAILFFALGGRYCGLGTNLISNSFHGGDIYSFDWIVKLALTIFTLSIGFQGGEVTPLFSIGASLGFVLGAVFGLPVEAIAAMGYAAVFGSATNTLIAPIFIGLEVFGPTNILPLSLVCVIAYIVNFNSSIYGGQISLKNFIIGKVKDGESK